MFSVFFFFCLVLLYVQFYFLVECKIIFVRLVDMQQTQNFSFSVFHFLAFHHLSLKCEISVALRAVAVWISMKLCFLFILELDCAIFPFFSLHVLCTTYQCWKQSVAIVKLQLFSLSPFVKSFAQTHGKACFPLSSTSDDEKQKKGKLHLKILFFEIAFRGMKLKARNRQWKFFPPRKNHCISSFHSILYYYPLIWNSKLRTTDFLISCSLFVFVLLGNFFFLSTFLV